MTERRKYKEMKVKLTLESQELDKEDLRCLVQSIRDCEIKYFPNKEISVWVEVPDLPTEECNQILAGIKPPYGYGPFVVRLDNK